MCGAMGPQLGGSEASGMQPALWEMLLLWLRAQVWSQEDLRWDSSSAPM